MTPREVRWLLVKSIWPTFTHIIVQVCDYVSDCTTNLIRSFCSVTFLTFDDPENSFALHSAALEDGTAIGALVAKAILEIEPSLIPVSGSYAKPFLWLDFVGWQTLVGWLVGKAFSHLWPSTNKPCYPFLSAMAATGRPLDQLLGNVLGIAVGSSVNFAHGQYFGS